MTTPVILRSQPGIQRDGTRFASERYLDGRWCRFDPNVKKMGGYSILTPDLWEITRGNIHSFSRGGKTYLHLGAQSTLTQVIFDPSLTLLGTEIRSPGGPTSFLVNRTANNPDNLWQIDSLYDANSDSTRVIAHPGVNLTHIDSAVDRPIYYGDITSPEVLTEVGYSTSGGIVAIPPYLFAYGSDGHIAWSVPNKPNDFVNAGSGESRVTGAKIVQGFPIRGSATPTALFWSLEAIIRGTYVGGTPIWDFDSLDNQASILSSQGIIQYDGIYYWPGIDRFLSYNGTIREVPNTQCQDYFFDNLNYAWRQKVYAYKVPRYGEIWWCYPRGSATECTHAVILNVRTGVWYDTELPNSGRSSGIYTQMQRIPLMSGVDANSDNKYNLWLHETGTDEVDELGNHVAIRSYFETSEQSILKSQQPQNRELKVGRLEPDFIQSGDMSVTVRGRANTRAAIKEEAPVTFSDSPSQSSEETIPLRAVRRLMSFKFESEVAGGNYEGGDHLVHLDPAGTRTNS